MEGKQRKRKKNVSSQLAELNWVEAGGGHFALRGKPSPSLISHLPTVNCSHVVTIQGEREGSIQTGNHVRENNMTWINIPFDKADIKNMIALPVVLVILERLNQICVALENGGRVLFHCAAGFHRTGLVSNLVLLFLGLSPEEAINKVRQSREITAQEVGSERLAYGEKFVGLCGTFKHPKSHDEIGSKIDKWFD